MSDRSTLFQDLPGLGEAPTGEMPGGGFPEVPEGGQILFDRSLPSLGELGNEGFPEHPNEVQIKRQLKDPEETEAKIELSQYLSGLYEQSPDAVWNHYPTYAKPVVGDQDSKNVLANFKDLFRYNWIYQKIGVLRGKQLLGDESEETEREIAQLKANLPNIEKIKQGFTPEFVKMFQTDIGVKGPQGTLFKLATILATRKELKEEVPEAFPSPIERTPYALANTLPSQLSTLKEGLIGAGMGALIGGGIGLATTGPGAVPAALKGAGTGYSVASGAKMALIEAGLAYDAMLEEELPDGTKLNPKAMKGTAIAVGIVSGALEGIGDFEFIKHTGLNRIVGRTIAEKLTRTFIAEQSSDVLSRALARHGTFVAKETMVEVAQETAQILGEAVVKEVTNKVDGTEFEQDWSEALPRYVQTVENSILAFNVMGSVGTIRAVLGPSERAQTTRTTVDESKMEPASRQPQGPSTEEAIKVLQEEHGLSPLEIETATKNAFGENSERYKDVRRYFHGEEATGETGTTDWFAESLKEFFPNMDEEQLEASRSLIEARARNLDMTADDYINQYVEERTKQLPEGAKRQAEVKKAYESLITPSKQEALEQLSARVREGLQANIDFFQTADPEYASLLETKQQTVEFMPKKEAEMYNRRLKAAQAIPNPMDRRRIIEGEYTIGDLRRSFEKDEWYQSFDDLLPSTKEEFQSALIPWGNKLIEELKGKKKTKAKRRVSDMRSLGVSGLWEAAAKSAAKGEIKDSLYQRLQKEIDNNPEKYKRVFAHISGDMETIRALETRPELSEYMKGKRARDRLRKAEIKDIRQKRDRLLKQKKKTEKMYPEQKEGIDTLLEDIDLVRLSSKKKVELSTLREMLQQSSDSEVSEYLLDQVERLDKKNINDLTVTEFNSLYDAVMHEVYTNRERQRIRIANQKLFVEEAVSQSVTEMKPLKDVADPFVEKVETRGKKKEWGRAGEILSHVFGVGQLHYDLLIEMLAGKNSTMDKVLFTAVKQGVKKEMQYSQQTFKEYNRAMVDSGVFDRIKNLEKWLNEKVTVGRFTLTRNERMALYRHSLNPDNKQSIIEGGFGFKNRGATERNKVFQLTEKEFSELINSLTEDEKFFAGDAVTDLFTKQYAEMNKVFLRKNGFELPAIKEGLYYPKDTMPVARQGTLESELEAKAFKETRQGIGLEKGMLQKRKDVTIPLYLNPLTTDINRSVRDAAAYIGLEIPLSNAAKLLYNKQFKSEFLQRYGSNIYREIEKGLKDIAGNRNMYSMLEAGLMKVKNNLATAYLGFNPAVMMKQVLSFPAYRPYVKAKYLAHGLTRSLLHNKEVLERHKMYSPEFWDRIESGATRDVSEALARNQEKKLYGGKKDIREISMAGIQFFDKRTVMAGMEGAVQQVLDEFENGKLSQEVKKALDMEDADVADLTVEEKMQKAYEYADYATERSQPMFRPEHRSGFSRGTVAEKMLSMFSSFTNQGLNALVRSVYDVKRTGTKADFKKFGSALMAFMVISPIGAALIDKLKDDLLRPEADDEELWKRYIHNVLGYLYIARDLERSVLSKIDRGTFLGYGLSLPIGRVANDGVDAIANTVRATIGEEEWGPAIESWIEFVTVLNGLPYPALKTYIMKPTGVTSIYKPPPKKGGSTF